MAQSAITRAFEAWNVKKVLDGFAAVPDKVVFALIPDQDESTPVDRDEGMPDESNIKHVADITQYGALNDNAVVYSVVLDTAVGDWDFNWIGLVDSETNTVLMIVHVRTQQKLATRNGQQGNSLTRNLSMQFDGAAEATQINVSAQTWQIDFSSRLFGMDEEHRLSMRDYYGDAAFLNDGFQVALDGERATINPGVGYVGGLRVLLNEPAMLEVAENTAIWLDVSRKGSVTGDWENKIVFRSVDDLADYTDATGYRHYVAKLARIIDGAVIDERKKPPIVALNNGIIAWERQIADEIKGINKNLGDVSNYITPEQFGAIGDGVTDDYQAIQRMFDNSPDGAVIVFDGRKKYLNAFAGDKGQGANWTIKKPLTVYFNGALFTRYTPRRNVDEQTALLYITGSGRVDVYNFRGDGNNEIGYAFDNSGNQLSEGYEISISQAINYGIWIQNTKDIAIHNCHIQKCAFNIWATGVKGLSVSGQINLSGQVVPNITEHELALGAGVKVGDCSFFNIDVRGTRNAHATVEIEPRNNHGVVRSLSYENIGTGLTIMDSSNIDFVSITENTQSGPGTQIFHDEHVDVMRNITGRVISEKCGDSGFRMYMKDNVKGNIENIILDVTSSNSKVYGCDIRNYSDSFTIDGLEMRYSGKDNVSRTSGNDLWLRGDVRGRVSGRSKGCYCGVIANGVNSKYGINISMDLQEVASIAYSQGVDYTVDWTGTKTKSEYKILPNVENLRIARSSVGGGTGAFGDVVIKANHFYFQGIPQTGVFAGEAWYDSNNANTLKIYKIT